MRPAVTDEEAMERAMAELGHRATQMTEAEFADVLTDRARELAGRPKLARLTQGRRLNGQELMILQVAIDSLLNDFYDVAMFGDARWEGADLVVLFRLVVRPDISYTIQVSQDKKQVNLREAGKYAALKAYDALTPEYIGKLIKAKPID